jgi:hypothetical protein
MIPSLLVFTILCICLTNLSSISLYRSIKVNIDNSVKPEILEAKLDEVEGFINTNKEKPLECAYKFLGLNFPFTDSNLHSSFPRYIKVFQSVLRINLNDRILSLAQKDLRVLHRLVLQVLNIINVFDITFEYSLYFWYAYDNEVYKSDSIGSWKLNKYLRLVRNANHAIYKYKLRNEKAKTNHDWLSPMEKLYISEIEMVKLGILHEMNKKLGRKQEMMMNL